ncbi:hypothetical protein N0V90_002492 [Kalmusia sp. IMI 367209]|nr:hypothetical protein N0V90_002492 [Kalmusia sp. IMI 367209]
MQRHPIVLITKKSRSKPKETDTSTKSSGGNDRRRLLRASDAIDKFKDDGMLDWDSNDRAPSLLQSKADNVCDSESPMSPATEDDNTPEPSLNVRYTSAVASSSGSGDEDDYVPSSDEDDDDGFSDAEHVSYPVLSSTKEDVAALRRACQEGMDVRATRTHGLCQGAVNARHILKHIRLKRSFKPAQSWCTYCTMSKGTTRENKDGYAHEGYIQVNAIGVTHFAYLQELVLWAGGHSKPGRLETVFKDGESLDESWDVSHLCHNQRCMVPQHIILEHKMDNQSRKGCDPWVKCSEACGRCNGQKVIIRCPHIPHCIKWHEGYQSHEELNEVGICRDDGPLSRTLGWYRKQQHNDLVNPVTFGKTSTKRFLIPS